MPLRRRRGTTPLIARFRSSSSEDGTGDASSLLSIKKLWKRHKHNAVWDFFEEVWMVRNEYAHGATGTSDPRLAAELTEKLLHYKRNASTLLHYGDRSWISQQDGEIDSWSVFRKRDMLRILDSWHRQYLAEQNARDGGQRSLLDFPGFTLSAG